MRKNTPLDAYNFLLAAGEIDSGDMTKRNITRCGEELLRISRMNGSYKNLPEDFRIDMRDIVQSACDEEAASKLGAIGERLLTIDALDAHARREVRAHCSALSRFWPVEGKELLVDDEH